MSCFKNLAEWTLRQQVASDDGNFVAEKHALTVKGFF